MCRCCQRFYENFYWNCFEEKFCFDESIAKYNPDEDEEYITEKNGIIGRIQPIDNNNIPVCSQPLGGENLMLSVKNNEEFRRETQVNVPMLGPEILAVFANSQIFQDHPPTKLTRINTRSFQPVAQAKDLAFPRDDQEQFIKKMEENLDEAINIINRENDMETTKKRITFTVTSDSSSDSNPSLSPKSLQAISPTTNLEEQESRNTSQINVNQVDGVILRPKLTERHQPLKLSIAPVKRRLRNVKGVSCFDIRSVVSETDIFAISGSISRISMTPEVPSISFSNLPKNYEDTPTIEKFKVSQSLYSIQTANEAKAIQDDFSMPRYFRGPSFLTQSSDNALQPSSVNSNTISHKIEKEKSKRLKAMRESLPPLLIPSIRKKD